MLLTPIIEMFLHDKKVAVNINNDYTKIVQKWHLNELIFISKVVASVMIRYLQVI